MAMQNRVGGREAIHHMKGRGISEAYTNTKNPIKTSAT